MKKFTVQEYEIQLNKKELPQEDITLVFLSDLHNVEIGKNNRDLLAAIEKIRPDAVLCGGDMIVGKSGKSVYTGRALMAALAEKYDVYSANGNHEYRTLIYPDQYPNMFEAYHGPLKAAGIHFLHNASELISVKGVPICIYGLDVSRRYYRRFQRKLMIPVSEIVECIGKPDRDVVSILLAHNPSYMDAYLEWGADLTLSGHFHGGVMRLGKHLGLVSPNMKMFPKYAHGLFRKKDSSAIVSAGLGEHTIPVRICNPRELVVIHLSVRNKNV